MASADSSFSLDMKAFPGLPIFDDLTEFADAVQRVATNLFAADMAASGLSTTTLMIVQSSERTIAGKLNDALRAEPEATYNLVLPTIASEEHARLVAVICPIRASTGAEALTVVAAGSTGVDSRLAYWDADENGVLTLGPWQPNHHVPPELAPLVKTVTG